jgi:hypothetical protein
MTNANAALVRLGCVKETRVVGGISVMRFFTFLWQK